MFVDYTDLNKACPKDSYPLLMIDRLVDVTFDFGIMSFMDAFSSYNQIWMVPEVPMGRKDALRLKLRRKRVRSDLWPG